MEDKLNEILCGMARIETKIDHHKETIDNHSKRLSGLENRWWTALGGFVLAIGAWMKNLIS